MLKLTPAVSLTFKQVVRYQSTLQSAQTLQRPSILESISSTSQNSTTDIPINVKALYFPPIKLPVKYGHLKLDIQLRSYDINSMEFFADFIQRIAFYLGIPMTGPKPLPKRHEKWTVIKSPFVHAKSKENFERFTYKRLLRCWDTNDDVVELLISYISKYSIAGVGVKCNLFKREPINMDQEWDATAVIKQFNLDSGQDTADPDDSIINSKILQLLNSKEFK